ncbi:max dimerization protein 4 isoform X1 [Micropterus dolomieu]|uniref:max dimerization protein 4 isoform X1 n=1 Tax=Micropterus dolomieu TaxID=147949 RepID=UPI001E8DFD2A|nr:max dimerization protein 4 isoform X1 [Micropterus dolomieu]
MRLFYHTVATFPERKRKPRLFPEKLRTIDRRTTSWRNTACSRTHGGRETREKHERSSLEPVLGSKYGSATWRTPRKRTRSLCRYKGLILRRAKLRLYLEQLKKLVPLGPDSTRHTTLSLLKRAKMHIKKLEEQDRKALNVKEQLQREHRYLKRRLEQLSVSGSVERIRTDSMGSTISTDSEQEVDIEGVEFTPVEADSVDSISDGEEEDHYSLQSSSSDTSYTATHSHRLQPHHC